MNKSTSKLLLAALCLAVAICPCLSPAATAKKKSAAPKSNRTPIPSRVASPYLGAIVEDAATGHVLFEDRADSAGYPASVVKLMDMLVILDRIERGQLTLNTQISVTREAEGIGGTQVWLKQGEVFTVDELLYALMLQSANDAAVALAIGVAGSQQAFVELMNQKAADLGMANTKFSSVHGLPPTGGQSADVSTPRDLALLARALIKRGAVLRYTSTQQRSFREGSSAMVIMRNHNHLLSSYPGCDGLKTGFITQGGFSLVATAERGGRRVIAVLIGCAAREERDLKAAELLSRGFTELPPLPPPAPALTNVPPTNAVTDAEEDVPSGGCSLRGWGVFLAGLAVGATSASLVFLVRGRRPKNPSF